MSTSFSVDTARIAEASGDIQRIAASIETDVRAMMARLTALQDCWRGSAAGSFAAVTQDWSATQERVRVSLQQISTTLRTAGDDYDLVEQANRARFLPQ
jgi:early secretory antigenic target protein ESAT-6